MRAAFGLVFLAALALAAYAQSPTTEQECPDILIQNYVWGALQRNVSSKDPKFEANSSGVPMDAKGNPINTVGNPINLAGVPLNTDPVRPQGSGRAGGNPAGGSVGMEQSVEVRYETYVGVKNIGAKTIKVVQWDYVFYTEPTLAQELKRYKYRSKKKLAPGAIGFLSEYVTKRAASRYQKVFINRVEFADGSVWQRP